MPGTKQYDVDHVADHLISFGYQARHMSPSYVGAKVKQPAVSPDGKFIGWMLPGRGLYIPGLDLDRLGINKRLPNVYEHTPIMRLRDKLRSEVGAITTYDGIIAARGGGKSNDAAANKASITTAAGFWSDLWTATGGSGAGVYLATTAPTDSLTTRATAGGLNTAIRDPGGTDKKYLLSFGCMFVSAQNMAVLIDRHSEAGAFRLSVTTAETVGVPKTITRNYGSSTLGAGCELIGVVTTARATPGAGTIAYTYLDQDGVSSTTTALAMAATADPVNRLIAGGSPVSVATPFQTLAAGDYGIRQISSSVRVAAADTTGVMNLGIVTPLVWIPALGVANVYVERDLPGDLTGLLELANTAQVTGALSMLLYANATTSGALNAFFRTCEG